MWEHIGRCLMTGFLYLTLSGIAAALIYALYELTMEAIESSKGAQRCLLSMLIFFLMLVILAELCYHGIIPEVR